MTRMKNRSYNYKFRGEGEFKGRRNAERKLSTPLWDTSKLKPFKKNFYQEPPHFHGRSTQNIAAFRDEKQINIFGRQVPDPIQEFSDYEFPDYIAKVMEKLQYIQPTAIQAQGWPIVLSGMDMVGIAETGSGKTLTYVLPAIVHISHQEKISMKEGPIALVLAPTRELAQQIVTVCRAFGGDSGIRSMCVFGGARKEPQIRDLEKGSHICVATPGRLIDFLEAGNINLRRCTFLVLDEADRMLDMGFGPQIKAAIAHIRPDKQTLMWSATWPTEVRKLAQEFLMDYVRVNTGSLDLSANHNITQIVDVCAESEKSGKLHKLLEEITANDEKAKVIIFAETKLKVADVTRSIKYKGFSAALIHGDSTQVERNFTLNEFRSGRASILVATDVAARGLDIDDVKFVINYDYASCSEDYVHRIGRTGRCNKSGTAYTFLTRKDGRKIEDLIGVLKEANQTIDPKLYEIMETGKSDKADFSGWGRQTKAIDAVVKDTDSDEEL